MKTKLVICFLLSATTVFAVYQNQQKKVLGDIALRNVEALARYEDDGLCQEWAIKTCYELFTSEYGPDYYATCAPTPMGGIAECGAHESHKPAAMSKINSCLQCIR